MTVELKLYEFPEIHIKDFEELNKDYFAFKIKQSNFTNWNISNSFYEVSPLMDGRIIRINYNLYYISDEEHNKIIKFEKRN